MDKRTLIKILEDTDINKICGFSIEYQDFSVENNIKKLSYEE